MTQNANQADGNQIMSSKMMDAIVYRLTSAAMMNVKLLMSNLAGKIDKKVERDGERGFTSSTKTACTEKFWENVVFSRVLRDSISHFLVGPLVGHKTVFKAYLM